MPFPCRTWTVIGTRAEWSAKSAASRRRISTSLRQGSANRVCTSRALPGPISPGRTMASLMAARFLQSDPLVYAEGEAQPHWSQSTPRAGHRACESDVRTHTSARYARCYNSGSALDVAARVANRPQTPAHGIGARAALPVYNMASLYQPYVRLPLSA